MTVSGCSGWAVEDLTVSDSHFALSPACEVLENRRWDPERNVFSLYKLEGFRNCDGLKIDSRKLSEIDKFFFLVHSSRMFKKNKIQIAEKDDDGGLIYSLLPKLRSKENL